MTKGFIAYVSLLVIIVIIHYMGIYDMRLISILIALCTSFLLLGGSHSSMRTYSSMDIKNVNYDTKRKLDEPGFETTLKLGIPLVVFIILILCR